MTLLTGMLGDALVERLGWTLVHFLWQGTMIGLLTASLLATLHAARAQTRYLVACTSMLALVLAPLATFVMLTPHTTLPMPPRAANAVSAGSVAAVPDVGTLRITLPEPGASPEHRLVVSAGAGRSVTAASNGGRVGGAAFSRRAGELYRHALASIDAAVPWLVQLWTLGICALSLRLAGGLAWIARVRRRGLHAASLELQQRVAFVAHRVGLRRDITLRISQRVDTPAVVGWLRPVVLLPASALSGLAPDQLEAVLAHELAHVRRHDYLVNLVQSVAETLLFYHPAVWYVSHQIRVEREHCCDDEAVASCGDAGMYAAALADLEQLRHGMPALAMTALGSRAALLRRVRRLLTPSPRTSSAGPTSISLLAMTLLAIGAAATHGNMSAATPQVATAQQPAPTPSPTPSVASTLSPTPSPAPAPVTATTPTPAPSATPVAATTPTSSPSAMPVAATTPTPAPAPTPRPRPTASADGAPVEDDQDVYLPPAPPEPPAASAPPAPPAPAARAVPRMPPVAVAPEPPEPPEPVLPPAARTPRAARTSRAFETTPPPAVPVPPVLAAPPAPAAPPVPPAWGSRAMPVPPAASVSRVPPVPAQAPRAPVPPLPASPMSPPSPPSPPAPPAPGLGADVSSCDCSFNMQSSDDHRSLRIRGHGRIEFSDDDADVNSLSNEGYLEIEERTSAGTARVEFSARRDGTIQRRWWHDGREASFDPEGRAWLARHLPDLMRRTGLGAEARVARILRQKGPEAVLEEVSRCESDYVKRVYLTNLLETPALDPMLRTSAISQAGREIRSNYDRRLALVTAITHGRPTEDAALAYADATRTMRSDYDRRLTLDALLNAMPLSDAALNAVLASTMQMRSAYDGANVLIRIAETQRLTPTLRQLYIDAADKLHSQYDRTRALAALSRHESASR